MSARALQPGIHHGVGIEVYHAIDACSSGRLKDMGRSAAYCRYQMDHPREDTPAMAVGSLVDALLLDPEAVTDYCVKDWDGRTKDGKARAAAVADAGLRVLSQDDWDRAHAIHEAVALSPWWADLRDVWTQTTVLWHDGDLDILCRARPDILAADGILADLKVCRQMAPSVYLRQAVTLYHPQQLAWYARGLEEQGHRVRERWILAVHPEPPHEVVAYRMAQDLNDWSDRVVMERASYYAECAKVNSWPGPTGEIDVPLPEWAKAGQTAVDFSTIEVEEEDDDGA